MARSIFGGSWSPETSSQAIPEEVSVRDFGRPFGDGQLQTRASGPQKLDQNKPLLAAAMYFDEIV